MQAPIHTFLPLAHKLADTAGEILRRHWRTALPPQRKPDESPVTLADKEVEQAIRAIIEAEAPGHGIIGEEFGNVGAESPYQWVIDPIDGTRAFMAGYPLFTTLIALAYEGKPLLGVIDQPILRERWAAAPGKAPGVKARECEALEGAVVASTSAPYFTQAQAAAYGALVKAGGHGVVGGDAYAYAMLASGQLDVVADAGMKPFDYCALVPVVEAAGGIITDWKGAPLTIHSDGSVLACASKKLHEKALALLSAA